MPRIDPLQLLKCLSVLLSPEGGILSRDEVPRLENLMKKFSKKLVSKCVYVLILKNTETSLVDMFMAEGGWTLIQDWLQDAAQTRNWDLVKEILGLLLITPVDVERLKINILPKLIKTLSRREDLDGVAQLSNQIVQKWLDIVKGTSHAVNTPQIQAPPPQPVIQESVTAVANECVEEKPVHTASIENVPKEPESNDSASDSSTSIKTSTFYKVSVRDGKQVFKKMPATGEVQDQEVKPVAAAGGVSPDQAEENADFSDETDGKVKDRRSKSSDINKSSSMASKKDRDKDKRKSSHSSSSSSKSKTSSSSSTSSPTSSRSRDKHKSDRSSKERNDKDKSSKDKDRNKEKHSSKSSSSSKSSHSKDRNESKDRSKEKTPKEKQAEKDKDTLARIKPPNVDKLGRIPKKAGNSMEEDQKKDEAKEVKKKPSFSILDRKSTGEERSKTVKVFNSKMRSTGLEEEAKPPPPRTSKKPTSSIQLPTIPPKRPSPPRDTSSVPPEKKLKIDKVDIPDRPGAIKLIPPKPKPAVLQESDMFMDALTASATKKEPKKRKRRLSATKEVPTSPTSSTPVAEQNSATTPASPLGLKNIAPINFYQDTLSEQAETNDENEENKENTESPQDSKDTPASPTAANDNNDTNESSPPKVSRTVDGLKGVLLYAKKKGPKRSVRWKTEEDLVDIRYFELDETERVNVTKTFMDMAKMEMSSEREALQLSRKPTNEDIMEPQTMWRMLYMCDQPDALAVPGCKSLEKDIQYAREKSVLQALYFDKRRIPDSAEEPIPENHQMSDPIIIPLDDPDSQEIDLRSTPWPEPKGSPPAHVEVPQVATPFQNVPFNQNFNAMNNIGNMAPPQFAGMPPRFVGPAGPHVPPMAPNFPPANMIHNNMMAPPNMHGPEMMNQNVFAPNPEGFIGPGNEMPNFHMHQFNGPPAPNMFGQNNFNFRGARGPFRRGGSNGGGWVRMSGPGPGNWKRGGGGHRGGRLCKNVQNHGYCRNRDNCPFVHPT